MRAFFYIFAAALLPVCNCRVLAGGSGAPDVLTREQFLKIRDEPASVYMAGGSGEIEQASAYTSSVKSMLEEMLRRNAEREPYKKEYSRMYSAWRSGVTVLAPLSDRDFSQCAGGAALAYTYPGEPYIYMCRQELGFSEEHTVEMLMHEMAHVIGYWDECVATKLQVAAVRKLGKIPYGNGYEECKQ
ncbi:MAG: hypothetical protein WC421_10665 [Elusimicrobiales bacterium]